MKPYQDFLNKTRELYALRSAQALLGWDQETMMPRLGGQARARTAAAVASIIHEKYSAVDLGEVLGQLQAAELAPHEAACVREVARDRRKLMAVPPSLARELAETTSLSQQAWSRARPGNDTAAFNPWLEKVLALRRQEAECLGYDKNPYDAMLDEYEPGARVEGLVPLLGEVQNTASDLLRRIREAGARPRRDFLERDFPVSAQKVFCRTVLAGMAFDVDAGRLDESAHPFTQGIWPTDVRLTTRYAPGDFAGALFSTIHEGGHGLYEQGFMPEHHGTPLAEAVSLGVHESQSRLWENQVGRGRAFWKHYFPELQRVFPTQLRDVGPEEFYRAVNAVQPSLIRTEADEVTYNLHVILRFDLERALFEGSLQVAELEGAWNNGMRELLGVESPEPRNGYLQDVHWSVGLMGYFPTYTLGNLIACQLMAAAGSAIPDLDTQLAAGAFKPLREWLRNNIHRHGRRFPPAELVERATGKPLTAQPFIAYLEEKFGALYEL